MCGYKMCTARNGYIEGVWLISVRVVCVWANLGRGRGVLSA